MIKLSEDQKERLVDSLITAISVGAFMFCLMLGVGSATGILYLIFT